MYSMIVNYGVSVCQTAWTAVCAAASRLPRLNQQQLRSMLCFALMFTFSYAFAQEGGGGGQTATSEALNQGITQFGDAVSTMAQFVPIIKNLCYILAVIFGLVGGVMIVIAMNNHEQDVNKKIAMTVGAVVFMLVIAQAIPLIFGVATT